MMNQFIITKLTSVIKNLINFYQKTKNNNH